MNARFDLPSLAAWWRWARQWRQNQLVETCDRVAVLDHVHDAGHLAPRYAFMIVMSCGIATLGLLQNSAAVIIGAMLISPLMGPIIGLGMGLATFDLRSIRESLLTLLVGIGLALAIAILIVAMSPLKEATSEILARTEPTFFDLLVAVFSGLAGAYATVTRKGEAIVGVAIATALMPPLAVVGYGIAVLNWNIAGGAAFLFMTNLLAIALSVTIVARLYGFGRSDSPKQTAWQAGLIVACFALLSVPLVLALKRIALQSQTEVAVRSALEGAASDAGGRVSALRVDNGKDGVSVDAVVMLSSHVSGLEERLQADLGARLQRPVSVRLREVLTADDVSFAQQQGTLAELRRSVLALETAETARSAQVRARADQQAAMQAALVPYLGRLERSADGSRWTLWLTANTLPLARALQMETELNAGRQDGEPVVEIYPPLQPLPPIELATPDATPDTPAVQVLAVQAWALQRWRAPSVTATLVMAEDEHAAAWEARLREALAARGVTITEIERERRGAPRLQLALASAP